jgi:UDP-N-acetylglucosamine 4,6-dehydratase
LYTPRTILITGGTGSWGQAATRYFLKHTDATIRIYSRSEHLQLDMAHALSGDEQRLRFFLGDIRDVERLRWAMRGVDTVFHAAALKHVHKGENDPAEFVHTNVNGTMNVIAACIDTGVKRAVLLSTDKAVAPVNLYGSTKMTAEKLWIRANSYSPHGTHFSAVRYGNVAGSRGSVIPLWRTQIRTGQSVRVTDLSMSRFWISLDEAVRLAWFSVTRARRGTLLIPHLPAYTMSDLLQALCELEGISPITMEYIGVRPGEKMHEELMTNDEAQRMAYVFHENALYYSIEPLAPSWEVAVPSAYCTIGEPYVSSTWQYRFTVEDLIDHIQETV